MRRPTIAVWEIHKASEILGIWREEKASRHRATGGTQARRSEGQSGGRSIGLGSELTYVADKRHQVSQAVVGDHPSISAVSGKAVRRLVIVTQCATFGRRVAPARRKVRLAEYKSLNGMIGIV